jgi:hypothetical protein
MNPSGQIQHRMAKFSIEWGLGSREEPNPANNVPGMNVSYRGEKGKTTGYYLPKGAAEATREGVAAWQEPQECLRELAELNKERNLRHAREADSR